jgi:carbonic anhydrase
MWSGISLLLLSFLYSCSTHWTYEGKSSAYEWGKISRDFKSCDLGTHQSPINLDLALAKTVDEVITFHYSPHTNTTIWNNGHTIEFDFEGKNYISIGGEKFYLRQMHAHAKSEHSLNNLFFPGELHFVHLSDRGKLAVVGFFIQLKSEEKDMIHLFSLIPDEGEKIYQQDFDLTKIIPKDTQHFYYEGSLSTPPCTEDVHWIIFDKPLLLSESDWERFKRYYSHNDRPLQKMREHQLKHSNK